MSEAVADSGSYRDPGGRIYVRENRVFRTVMPVAQDDFDFVSNSSLWQTLIDEGVLLDAVAVESSEAGISVGDDVRIVEHPRIAHISYPYEWSFSALKRAALLQLRIHQRALEHGITLSDASAYNIQFIGPRPVFIDHLSFRRYREGEYWSGHRQFCEQYLNPLLLRSKLGVPHNNWYRGSLEGIGVVEMNDLLPLGKKLSWKMLVHVVLQARFQSGQKGSQTAKESTQKKALPKNGFEFMLKGLESWIAKLEPGDSSSTTWSEYANSHSYADDEVVQKKDFIAKFVEDREIRSVWDIGCNTGDYSKVALESGAKSVIGFDFDQQALDQAFSRAEKEELAFLPLFLDAVNPSPNQGWAQRERKGFGERDTPDGLIALAVVHHLAVARNVPVEMVVSWLIGLSPAGVIEFVPKSDPMVQALLSLRVDVFEDYCEETFLAAVSQHAEVIRQQVVSSSGRLLVQYQRATA